MTALRKHKAKPLALDIREQWLDEAAARLAGELFEQYDAPEVRVSCGWPSKAATSVSKRRIGECWDSKASADGLHQIFISPTLDKAEDVLDVLVHELIHAIVGVKEGHRSAFRAVAVKVGLTGKMTATKAGPVLSAGLADLARELGDYPHAKLNPAKSGIKKQKGRLLKASCPECDYTVRVTKSWADLGMPICPVDGHAFKLEGSSEEDNGED